jgi:hypothetical protein
MEEPRKIYFLEGTNEKIDLVGRTLEMRPLGNLEGSRQK